MEPVNEASQKPQQTYRKHFIPLESNPDVFTELVHKLGISQSLSFQDVLSLDDPDVLAFIPRPAYGLVLVFPTTEPYEKACAQEAERLGEYEGSGAEEPVVFWKQTINNACGLYALLHAITNGDARTHIANGSIVARILEAALPLKPGERAMVLEESKELEAAYASVARKGDTQAPDNPEDEVDFHYICFVKSHQDGHLYQLDGMRKRPIDLGPMKTEDDVLSEVCLSAIRRMTKEVTRDVLHFSLMALAPAQD